MSSPSKRRRTSPSTYFAVNGENDDNATRSGPATPKRASYLSPTKASLARSNPNILAQASEAKARRESSPNRRRSLRDAILGRRDEADQDNGQMQDIEQTANTEKGMNAQQEEEEEEEEEVAADNDQLATDIAKAFEQPHDINIPAPTQPRSPLRIRKPSIPLYTPPRNRSVPTITTPLIVPKLVQGTSKGADDGLSDRRGAEEELPPTPVDLGKDTADRPRGLVSSSPAGSARRRVRGQNGTSTSSPLKPREPLPELSEDEIEEMEAASGLGEELEEQGDFNENGRVDEDLLEEMQATPKDAADHAEEQQQQHDLDDPVIRDKQSQLQALQDQLKALQTECCELEELGATITKLNTKNLDSTSLDSSLELLLSSVNKPLDPLNPLNPPLESHRLFKKDPSAFLTLFAPANLLMSYETWEKQVRGRQKFVYQTTFAAPKPWPINALNITFETTIDLEDDEVEKIEFNNTSNKPMSASLEKWVSGRLTDPVLGSDLATLVTGVGRYFEEDVKRAKVLNELAERYPTLNFVPMNPDSAETLLLLPYLSKSQISFTSPTTATQRTRRSASSAVIKEIMLIYDIHLSWIGQPRTSIDVVISGFSSKAMHHARKLFREIEPVRGVVSAFEGIWEVLSMGQGIIAQEADGSKGKGKGKARKSSARRMTEFN